MVWWKFSFNQCKRQVTPRLRDSVPLSGPWSQTIVKLYLSSLYIKLMQSFRFCQNSSSISVCSYLSSLLNSLLITFLHDFYNLPVLEFLYYRYYKESVLRWHYHIMSVVFYKWLYLSFFINCLFGLLNVIRSSSSALISTDVILF